MVSNSLLTEPIHDSLFAAELIQIELKFLSDSDGRSQRVDDQLGAALNRILHQWHRIGVYIRLTQIFIYGTKTRILGNWG